MKTEHIFIGDEFADHTVEPKNVTRREKITNHVNGTITELTFYEEGFIKIRENNKSKRNKEHVLEFRFLDPDPISNRRTATACLCSALALGFLALIASFVLPKIGLSQYALSGTAVLSTLAVLSLLFTIYRSEVNHQFRTASGQTVVLTLTGSFGCIRKMRALAADIRQEIAAVDKRGEGHQEHYLRAEMKAHYKLAETGVITREACSNGTSLILAKFG